MIETIYNPLVQLDRWSPLIALMQAVIDGGDPLTYAPHILRDRFTIAGAELGPRHVVMIEVVGDQVLSNLGTEALARGLHVLEPKLLTHDRDETRFPRLEAEITIPNPIYETLDQVFELLASHRTTDVPHVKLTKAPTRDFDADGVTDDVDARPYDPAMH